MWRKLKTENKEKVENRIIRRKLKQNIRRRLKTEYKKKVKKRK